MISIAAWITLGQFAKIYGKKPWDFEMSKEPLDPL